MGPALHSAARKRKAQEAEQTSETPTGAKQGRGLFSGFGSWLGMGRQQGAASEAPNPLTDVDITAEATTGGEGATRSSFDVGLICPFSEITVYTISSFPAIFTESSLNCITICMVAHQEKQSLCALCLVSLCSAMIQ